VLGIIEVIDRYGRFLKIGGRGPVPVLRIRQEPVIPSSSILLVAYSVNHVLVAGEIGGIVEWYLVRSEWRLGAKRVVK